MKHNIKKKMIVDLTLDSSETIMLNQGGKHTIKFTRFESEDEEVSQIFNSSEYDEIEITIQLEKSHQGRHDHILKSSTMHNIREENETKQT